HARRSGSCDEADIGVKCLECDPFDLARAVDDRNQRLLADIRPARPCRIGAKLACNWLGLDLTECLVDELVAQIRGRRPSVDRCAIGRYCMYENDLPRAACGPDLD